MESNFIVTIRNADTGEGINLKLKVSENTLPIEMEGAIGKFTKTACIPFILYNIGKIPMPSFLEKGYEDMRNALTGEKYNEKNSLPLP